MHVATKTLASLPQLSTAVFCAKAGSAVSHRCNAALNSIRRVRMDLVTQGPEEITFVGIMTMPLEEKEGNYHYH